MSRQGRKKKRPVGRREVQLVIIRTTEIVSPTLENRGGFGMQNYKGTAIHRLKF